MSVKARLYRPQRRRSLLILVVLLGAGPGIMGLVGPVEAAKTRQPADLSSNGSACDTLYSTDVITSHFYMPMVSRTQVCQPTGASYGTLEIPDWAPTPPAELHADLNLALRGYTLEKNAFLGLVNLGGDTDPQAPQLAGLFATPRAPIFKAAYKVYNWDWDCNCRGAPIDDVEVSLADLAGTPGETIHVPDSGYGLGGGYEVLVLYASAQRLTLKYTMEDSVIYGYTLHLENICLDPNLLALYQALNSAGRHELPALRPGQTVGRVYSNGRVGVAIRDTGAFMETRSRKDWWHGY